MNDGTLARLSLLLDEREISRTIMGYSSGIDYGHPDAWLDLWTEDATYELHLRPGVTLKGFGEPTSLPNGLRHEGRDKLAKFIAAHSHAPDRFHKHLVCNLTIDVAGDEARCQSYFVRIDEIEDRSVPVAFGRYIDKLRRCPDGKWRFTARIAELEGGNGPHSSS